MTTGLSPQSTWKWNWQNAREGRGNGEGLEALTCVGDEQSLALRLKIAHPAGLEIMSCLKTPVVSVKMNA